MACRRSSGTATVFEGGVGASDEAEAAGAPVAAVSPGCPIRATTVSTGAVSPSLTRISVTIPAEGDGISASTLSVEISKRGSSLATASPTFLFHRITVPSVIDSPSCGIKTLVAIARDTLTLVLAFGQARCLQSTPRKLHHMKSQDQDNSRRG